jgi:hypothetical protein
MHTDVLLLQHAQSLLQAWRLALLNITADQQHQPQIHAGPHCSSQQQMGCQKSAAHTNGSKCDLTGFAGAACLAEIDLPLAAMQQLELPLSCDAQQLLQLCFPGLLTNQQQQQEEDAEDQQVNKSPATAAEVIAVGERAAGFAGGFTAAGPMAVLCAVADGLETMSSAGVELLTAGLQRSVHLAAAQHQQQQGESEPHICMPRPCSSWLTEQWLAAATTGSSRFSSGFDGQQMAGDSPSITGSVAGTLPAVAKQVLVVVTDCIKLLRKQ